MSEFFSDANNYSDQVKLFDMLGDALILVDADTGLILYMNEKARHIYGFTEEHFRSMHIAEICVDKKSYKEKLLILRAGKDKHHNFVMKHRSKAGNIIAVGLDVRYIKLHIANVYAIKVRDITTSIKLQEDVRLAAKIQRGILPPDVDNEYLCMKAIYTPRYHISGDSYGYLWKNKESMFLGYLIDVMGHGMSAALQTSSARVLFQQVAEAGIPFGKKMEILNKNVMPYIADDVLVSAIGFEFDFNNMVLSCMSAGINYFYHVRNEKTRIIKLPGSIIGLEDGEYGQISINIKPEDRFYFFSDGLNDILPEGVNLYDGSFENSVEMLLRLVHSEQCRDDATAMCFLIK